MSAPTVRGVRGPRGVGASYPGSCDGISVLRGGRGLKASARRAIPYGRTTDRVAGRQSRVAQLAEQPAVNRQVPSSSLGAGASALVSDQMVVDVGTSAAAGRLSWRQWSRQ